ncbi:MAG: anti-sigma factor [Alphaproteobacteria bacterium]
MSIEDRIDDTELHAYLDGELGEEESRAVEAWLAAHPDDAARVAAWRGQKNALAGLGEEILDETPPERMTRALDAAPLPATRRDRASWMRAAAALVVFVAGAAAGWWLHGSGLTGAATREVVFVDRAAGAHVVFTRERRHAVEARADKEERHLVRWLSRRLGRNLNPPSLDGAGFRLIGGRLVADDGGPAAQFMYQDSEKRRLTIYVRRARDVKNVAFRIAETRGVSAFYWIEKPYAYALIGKMERQELLKLGRLVFDHLNAPAR